MQLREKNIINFNEILKHLLQKVSTIVTKPKLITNIFMQANWTQLFCICSDNVCVVNCSINAASNDKHFFKIFLEILKQTHQNF